MAVFCKTTMSDIGQQWQRVRRFALMGGAAQLALLCSFGLTACASPSGPRLVSIMTVHTPVNRDRTSFDAWR